MWYNEENEKTNNFMFIESKELVELDAKSNTYIVQKSLVIDFEHKLIRAMDNSKTNGKIVVLDLLGHEELIKEAFKDLFKYEHIEIIKLSNESEIVDTIKNYVDEHAPINNYVVVDSKSVKNMQVHFPLHCVYINDGKNTSFYNQIKRKFRYGNGWEKDYMFYKFEDINDNFENVIFLDIDGVLNRDKMSYEEGYEDEPKVVKEFVKNLADIVKQTKAEIILSSSWRRGITRFGDGSLYEEEEAAIRDLFTYFSEYNLCIAGATPIIRNGPDGRPLEIRTWLAKRPSVLNYVILDDEDFWMWNWIDNHVVTTSYIVEEEETWDCNGRHAGLEEKYIPEVIEKLTMFREKIA